MRDTHRRTGVARRQPRPGQPLIGRSDPDGGMSGRFANYPLPMPTDPDDWRRQGQERDLQPGTVFVARDYRALDERWEHDHCEMCWAKFMDPHSADHAQLLGEHPGVLTAGLVTRVVERPKERWVCEPCFEDFATEFGWVLSPA
jgi:hypothetical protein